MRIAVFDHRVARNVPSGMCNLTFLEALSSEHDFTVFASACENTTPNSIQWVRLPLPRRPQLLAFVAYQFLLPFAYAGHVLRRRSSFDLSVVTESKCLLGNVAYAHFCHRAYLKYQWKSVRARGIRGWLGWLNHRVNALFEPIVYSRVRHIVVPSHGLARELESEYPFTAGKIVVIANPVDVQSMRPPIGVDFRKELGFSPDDVVFVFVALGHFERKGLNLLLRALKQLDDTRIKLLVVGGEPDLVSSYIGYAASLDLSKRTKFVGMQQDVRRYLWAADVFALPSAYEVFPLVALEAAAAGLPLLVTRLSGVEEFIREGENGMVVERTVESISSALNRFVGLGADRRSKMGLASQRSVEDYSKENFVENWRAFYRSLK